MPYGMLFFSESSLVNILEESMNYFFILDILVTFNTAILDPINNCLIVDRKQIALAYLKGFFFIDFISSFPFDLVSPSVGSANRLLRILKIPWLIKIVKLMKLMKI